MRFFLISVFSLIVLVAGIYGAGSALPEEMVTIRGVQLKAPVEEVWELVTDYSQLPRWNDGIASVTPLPEEGSQQTLWDITDTADNHMLLKVTLSEPMTRHRSEIIKNDLPFKGSWLFELTPNEGGTWLKVEEHSFIVNPLRRFLAYYLMGTDYGIRAYLKAMGRHLVQDVEIKELAA